MRESEGGIKAYFRWRKPSILFTGAQQEKNIAEESKNINDELDKSYHERKFGNHLGD